MLELGSGTIYWRRSEPRLLALTFLVVLPTGNEDTRNGDLRPQGRRAERPKRLPIMVSYIFSNEVLGRDNKAYQIPRTSSEYGSTGHPVVISATLTF